MLCTLSAAILWRTIIETFSLALRSDQYTHIILIFPISAALIASEWSWTRSSSFLHAQVGAYLFAFGILILAFNKWWPAWPSPDVRLAAGMLALVMLWISSFVMCFGTSIARSLLFPLCFLFWLIPIPVFLLVKIVQGLQQGSAVAAWLLFSAAGVPTVRDGVFVSIPGLSIEVARECSSIRSSLMLLVTTMVLTHVFLKTSWRKTLVILFAIPLSVAKNGVRIFILAMLGTKIDRRFLTGRLHHDGGIVFFILALLAILAFLWCLRKGERAILKMPSPSPPTIGRIPQFVIDER